jgi:hypothetical protein
MCFPLIHGASSTGGGAGATTAFLYVVAANFNASNAKLVDCVDENGTVVATCSIPATGVSTLTVDEFDSFGSHTYSLKIRAASGGETFNLQLDHASIVIPQTDGGRAKMCFPLIHGASSTGGGAGSAQANNNFAWCEEVRNSTGYSYCGLGGTRDSGIRIFKKTEANFATIESWELEVFARPKSDGTADSAFVALFNKTTGQMVTGTEMQFDDQSSTHNMARAVASFSNAAANFTDGDEFEIRLKTASTHIQLQIAKINLNVYLSPAQKAESHLAVYTDGLGRGSTSSTARRLTRYKHLPTMFRDGTEFFFEGTAKETGGSSHLFLFDAGTSDSGVSGSDVSGSQLDFSTSARERQRSAALTLTDGNRYLYRAASSSGQTITCASAFVIAIVPEES